MVRLRLEKKFRSCSKLQEIFNLGPEFAPDGKHSDYLLADGEVLKIGKLTAKAIFTPGHTPADLSYQCDDAIFVGDTLFMPEVGAARADFPGGKARELFRSIRKLLEFPPKTRLLLCHDYPPSGREAHWETTVGEQRASNIHVRDGISEDEFVAMRHARDRTLAMPTLLLPSVQVNVRAGQMPPPEDNRISYLKIPENTTERTLKRRKAMIAEQKGKVLCRDSAPPTWWENANLK